MGVDVTYVGSAYSDLDNSADLKVDDYIKTDARVQYLYADFTVDFYINNLTNEDIVYFKSSDSAYVGQTRTIGLNVTYSL
ncbi:TonB dependent receptor [Vibrio xiamenensis]|uniref:TonB dependent receptor n=1 Tax=Vibrio xiamenensis TaxID=861298 RepID=A0A1G7XZW7_9VIBR|nr:TonB-dependent receptor [Vibrio xiamenensis]SDG89735.1 TonB dependent receptor [Vibrio xiamenensis]